MLLFEPDTIYEIMAGRPWKPLSAPKQPAERVHGHLNTRATLSGLPAIPILVHPSRVGFPSGPAQIVHSVAMHNLLHHSRIKTVPSRRTRIRIIWKRLRLLSFSVHAHKHHSRHWRRSGPIPTRLRSTTTRTTTRPSTRASTRTSTRTLRSASRWRRRRIIHGKDAIIIAYTY